MILIIGGSILLILEIITAILYYKAGHEPTQLEFWDVIVTVYLALLTIFVGVNIK